MAQIPVAILTMEKQIRHPLPAQRMPVSLVSEAWAKFGQGMGGLEYALQEGEITIIQRPGQTQNLVRGCRIRPIDRMGWNRCAAAQQEYKKKLTHRHGVQFVTASIF
ncbi:hypothetical protein GCM10025772_05030 [Ferrimonas gelatinilytica]|uniref:Uncharacterized protein n=1 Tax=Ferrimonas gelatinilytica TaxID=1255257 RepID=A0ABP9RUG6_9GAMM